MELKKLSKCSLEEILCDLMDEIEETDKELFEKYEEIIEDELYDIDESEALQIARDMKPYGDVFTMNEVKETLSKMQIPQNECIQYFLCMNMFYNDYKSYAESKRLDIKDFCFEMSRLFINDIDAPKHKVIKYFKSFE